MRWGAWKERADRWTGVATAISAIIAGVALCFTAIQIYSETSDREQQRYNTAWVLVNTASISGHNAIEGGRREALSYLRDGKRSLQGAQLSNAMLSHVTLDGTDLNRSNMEHADLFGADLRAASLWGAYMRDANLQFSQLQGADLEDATLTCADLRGARLEKLDLAKYLRGTIKWRSELFHRFQIKYLEGRVSNEMIFMQLKSLPHGGKRLKTLEPVYTSLKRTKLEFAHLEGADMTGAKMEGAILKNAYLGKYKDTFDRANCCRRESKGLRWLPAENREEICKWTGERRMELPKGFHCAGPENKSAADVPWLRWLVAERDSTKKSTADVPSADLTGADLTGADLTGAVGITIEQISVAARLCKTTLPDGKRSYRDCPEQAPQ